MEPQTSVHFAYRTEYDESPDLSWLEQTDEQMSEGFEETAAARRRAYSADEWHMVGVIVTATDTTPNRMTRTEHTASLWGIESDSEPDYFPCVAYELATELCAETGIPETAIPQAWKDAHTRQYADTPQAATA